jgi:hypothetical protein
MDFQGSPVFETSIVDSDNLILFDCMGRVTPVIAWPLQVKINNPHFDDE